MNPPQTLAIIRRALVELFPELADPPERAMEDTTGTACFYFPEHTFQLIDADAGTVIAVHERRPGNLVAFTIYDVEGQPLGDDWALVGEPKLN